MLHHSLFFFFFFYVSTHKDCFCVLFCICYCADIYKVFKIKEVLERLCCHTLGFPSAQPWPVSRMHHRSWCRTPPWCLMYINTKMLQLFPWIHHSLSKRGGIEKQSLFLLELGWQSFIVSWDRAAPLHVLHLHVQHQEVLSMVKQAPDALIN